MEKYLQLLLKEANTVIIPGLGALTITNDKTGEIMFMPYLKYDDGKLSSFIKEKKGVSDEEAKRLIEVKVESVLSNLDNGSNAQLSGLGFFSKDNSGDIIFTNDSTQRENENKEEKETFSNQTIDEIPSIIPEVDHLVNETKSIPEEIIEKVDTASELEEPISIPVEKKKGFFGLFQRKKEKSAPIVDEVKTVSEENKIEEVEDSKINLENEIVEEKRIVEIVDQEEISFDVVNITELEDEEIEVKNVTEILIESTIKSNEEIFTVESSDEIEDLNVIPNVKTVEVVNDTNIDSEEFENEVEIEEDFLESDQDEIVYKKKKGVGFFVKMFLLIAIVTSGILIGINFKNVQEHIPFLSHEKEKTEEQKMIDKLASDKTKPNSAEETKSEELITPDEEVSVEAVPVSTAKEEKVNAKPIASHSAESLNEPMDVKQTFYIVIGSFSNVSNAERAVSKLVSEGNNSAKTVEKNGKHLVTISSYSNIDDANVGVKTFKETYAKAWILKY